MCKCLETMAITSLDDLGDHHHKNCPKYKTEKHPRLFYYEEALSYWTPAPEKVSDLIVVSDQLEHDEKMEIEFQRVDMTDSEYAAIPVD